MLPPMDFMIARVATCKNLLCRALPSASWSICHSVVASPNLCGTGGRVFPGFREIGDSRRAPAQRHRDAVRNDSTPEDAEGTPQW
jgi:hypothetical protein